MTARASDCSYIVPTPEKINSVKIESQKLVFGDRGRFEIGLASPAATLAGGSEGVIFKYANGATISVRELKAADIMPDIPSKLSLASFMRLVFLHEIGSATSDDQVNADAIRLAMFNGCRKSRYWTLNGVDIFGYAYARGPNDIYHAYYIIDGDKVRYLEIEGTDNFALKTFATMNIRK